MNRSRFVVMVLVAGMIPQTGCRKNEMRRASTGSGQGSRPRSAGPGTRRSAMRIPTCDGKDDFLSKEEKKTLLRLARRSLEQSVTRQERPVESKLIEGLRIDEELRKPMGAFVTLNENGRLRGCIGYLQPVEPLYRAVINNARNAALRDHRFRPVQPPELPFIDIEISVLSVPVPVPGPDAIKIGCHGIILRKAGRRATYLPQVAPEQHWNLEQTLSHLSMKAGLASDAWRHGAEFLVYTALVFSEKELFGGTAEEGKEE